MFFFFKQKTAYEMRISDWSSDVCSSDLFEHAPIAGWRGVFGMQGARSDFSALGEESFLPKTITKSLGIFLLEEYRLQNWRFEAGVRQERQSITPQGTQARSTLGGTSLSTAAVWDFAPMYSLALRSEEHTSELQSLMR